MQIPMKKILFVINSLGPGGAERQLIELIKGLRCSYECHLAILQDDEDHYLEDAHQLCKSVSLFPRRSTYDFSPIWQIAKACRQLNIDIVQTYLPLGSFYGVLAAKLAGRPSVCCAIRDAKDDNNKKRWLILLLEKLSTVMVANSKAGLCNRFGLLRDNMKVVYNGIDFSRFDLDKEKTEEVKSELNIGNAYAVAMVAAFANRKDHETLVKALACLVREGRDIKLLLVGEGITKAAVTALALSEGVLDRIIFTGFRSDVLYLIKNMNLCVLLSNDKVHQEGISNSIIESMAMGIPVVATNSGGTVEVIDGSNGILVADGSVVAVASAIAKMMDDSLVYERCSTQAIATIKSKMSYDHYISEYQAIYKHLFDG